MTDHLRTDSQKIAARSGLAAAEHIVEVLTHTLGIPPGVVRLVEALTASAIGAAVESVTIRSDGVDVVDERSTPSATAGFDPPGREHTCGDALGLRRCRMAPASWKPEG